MIVAAAPLLGGADGYISLVCAELFMVLTRTREITILLKADSQRTRLEQEETARGLGRAVIIEGVLYLPASVFLVLIIVRPLMLLLPFAAVISQGSAGYALAGLLGLLSYQFPFAAVRRIVTRIALNTLQSFASIALKADDSPAPVIPASSESHYQPDVK